MQFHLALCLVEPKTQTPSILAQTDCTVPHSMCRLSKTGVTLSCAALLQPDSKRELLHMTPV